MLYEVITEYFAHHKKFEELKALADYAIAESYPHLIGEANIYELFFIEVVGKTAMRNNFV